MIAYFDTSAVVKLLVAEEGSDLADELWKRSSLRIASRLVYPEARAALAAAARTGRITAKDLRTTVGDLEAATTALRIIDIDQALAHTAGELAERHGLRGYDAVHLATALSIDAPEVVIVTWDRELAAAATESGRTVVPN